MSRLGVVLIFLVTIISFSGCEKDDICVDGDTPLLIIRFYDAEDTTQFKAVPSLRVAGLGQNVTVNTIDDRTSTLDSIAIPLKTVETETGFIFISDSADDENGAETGNADVLNFSYEIQQEFVSRACGFISNYDNLTTDFSASADNWIQNVEVVKPQVTLETEEITAHVKIFH